MKYYIIAGEASGDLHASNLVAEIKKKDKKAEFRGFGGDLMKAQGVDLVKHYRMMAYMGFVEVAVNLRRCWVISRCVRRISLSINQISLFWWIIQASISVSPTSLMRKASR